MFSNYSDLADKTAIITGASRGIGKAIAIKLASCGTNISLVARSEDKLDEVQTIINNAGGNAHSIIANVADLDSFSNITSVAEVAEATAIVTHLTPRLAVVAGNSCVQLSKVACPSSTVNSLSAKL